MEGLRVYHAILNEVPTTLRLTAADAEKRGLTDADLVQASTTDPPVPPVKQRRPPNKARRAAADKEGG